MNKEIHFIQINRSLVEKADKKAKEMNYLKKDKNVILKFIMMSEKIFMVRIKPNILNIKTGKNINLNLINFKKIKLIIIGLSIHLE